MRIAVVNNDAVFLQLMRDLLTENGYETITLKEGETAFEMIRREQPNLVILDIRLKYPEEGWEVLQLLKLDPATGHIPVIACSTDRAFLEAKEDWLRERGCFTLEKPFELDDLLAKVGEVTGSETA